MEYITFKLLLNLFVIPRKSIKDVRTKSRKIDLSPLSENVCTGSTSPCRCGLTGQPFLTADVFYGQFLKQYVKLSFKNSKRFRKFMKNTSV